MHVIAGKTPRWFDYEVFLNGIELKYVLEINTDEGWMIRVKQDSEGKLLIHSSGAMYKLERIENLTGLEVKLKEKGK